MPNEDDLCDQCMRSGVEISHTLNDVTICADCSTPSHDCPSLITSLASDIRAELHGNEKTTSLLLLAEALRDHKWTRVLPALQTIHSSYGRVPPGHIQIQQEALESLLLSAEQCWGQEAAVDLRRSFVLDE